MPMHALTASALIIAVALSAAEVRADPERKVPEAPSLALPVLGVAIALGGGAMVYNHAREARTGRPSCLRFDGGCYWLGLGGTTLEQGGGALLAYWAWRLGQRDHALDPSRDHGGKRIGGLVIGGVAFAAIYVAAIYGAVAPFGCIDQAASELDYQCIGRKQYAAELVALGAAPVLLVAAPVAAYAIGYDDARRASGRRRALLWQLAPLVRPSATGLTVSGIF